MSAAPVPSLLSPVQRRIVAAALTLLALLGTAALLVATLMALGASLRFFSSVLWPIAVAGVLALILRPLVELLERRLKIRRLVAVVLLYSAFALGFTGVLVAFVPPLVDQTLDFAGYAPTLWENVVGYIRQHYPQWIALVQRQLDNPAMRQASEKLVEESRTLLSHALPSLRAAGGGALGIFAFFTHLAIIPVYLFFFLLARGEPTHQLPAHLGFLPPSLRDDVVFLVREFIGIVESFFRGQLLIGLIMGVLLALGFTVIGLKFGLVIGLLVGLLNIVPYLGTILGLAVTLPLAFFQPGGGWQLLGLVLVVKLVVQFVESWMLTPKIMGRQTGLHPVAIIFAVFFWGTAFDGILGMLLAIPLTAFVVIAWRLARLKYLSATVSA